MSDTEQPSRQEIHERAAALPFVGKGEIINHLSALALYHDLSENGSELPDHLNQQINRLVDHALGNLPDAAQPNFKIASEIQIRSIVSRAVIAGASQAASDIGAGLNDIERLNSIFNRPETGEADTKDD